jgi:hypothetical protein
MAKDKKSKSKGMSATSYKEKSKKSRKGVHAKTKSSKCKTSKLYKKTSRGQG